jgi:predicted NAD/FAD-binding protein
MTRRVVVVGSGIAGLTAAYYLAKASRGDLTIELLEKEPALGGHSLTVTVPSEGGAAGAEEAVDVGFQVLNRATYPHLLKLYDELAIAVRRTDMSFAISLLDGHGWRHAADPALYARWLLRAPGQMWAFLASKHRFHADALAALADRRHMPLGAWLQTRAYAPIFISGWLKPFCAAVWSLDGDAVDDMDLYALLDFLSNHGFLSWRTFEWFVPVGRADAEVQAIRRFLDAQPNVTVRSGVAVRSLADCGAFDALVLATDAATARSILGSSAPAWLEPFQSTRSTVYLHRDAALMPAARSLWSSWNVVQVDRADVDKQRSKSDTAHFGVTYWLKPLQHVADDALFVSLVPGATPPRRAPDADTIVWERELVHPQLASGAFAAQRRANHELACGGIALGGGKQRVFLAGAWLGTCFHESGVTTGALAARYALEHVLPSAARSVPVWRTSPPSAATASPAWFYRATTAHASQLAGQHHFAYDLPEVCAVDVQRPPVFWWGGFVRSDHFGAKNVPLLHALVEAVHNQLGFWCVGPVDCITTLRAFGQVNNPISVYLLWRDDERTHIDAVALEVTNYPWGERTLYALAGGDNRGSDAAALSVRGRFRKTMHVSPFHQHPSLVKHAYECAISVTPSAPSFDDRAAPFQRFSMRLRLLDEGDDDKQLHEATLTLREPTWRAARAWPVALQTSVRILRQAAHLQTLGRTLFAHVSLPHAPFSDVVAMSAALCVVLVGVLGARIVTALVVAALVRLAIQRRLRDVVDVPPLRDALVGAVLTLAVAFSLF